MKVYIGPYKGYLGIYDIVHVLEKFRVSEDRCYEIGHRLERSWFGSLVRWINDLYGERKIKVRIDPYDTYSMDHTLALIILPMLKQLKASSHSVGSVKDEDVPEELRSTSAPPVTDQEFLDANYFKRWEWVLDEMIFSFDAIANHGDEVFFDGHKVNHEALNAHYDRIDNGTRLFGKYYQSLWD